MDFEEIARKFLEAVGSEPDSYTSVKHEIIKNNENSFSLLTPDYLFYAANGRGPGKAPPLEPILDFVKRRNVRFRNLSTKGTAQAIQASIKYKGTKNWNPNGTDPLRSAVDKYQKKYEEDLNLYLFQEVKIEIEDSVNETIKEGLEENLKTFKF